MRARAAARTVKFFHYGRTVKEFPQSMGKFLKHEKQEYLPFLIALFLVTCPNLLYVIMEDTQSTGRKLGFFLFSSSLSLIPLFLFSKRIKTYFLVLLPFAVLSPFDMLFIYLYKHPVDVTSLGAIFETNLVEAYEFLSGFKAILIMTVVAAFACLCLYIFVLGKMQTGLSGKICSSVSLSCLTCALLVFVAPPLWRSKESPDIRLFGARIANSYPAGIILTSIEYFQWNRSIRNRAKQMRNLPLNARRNNSVHGKGIYVLIIGESARYGNFSLNGYYRETSPRLGALDNLVSYTDVCAAATETRSAIPVLLSQPTGGIKSADAPGPGIATFFKRAGFRTVWISNQERLGEYDTTASTFAAESDFVLFINKTSLLNLDRFKFDEEILPALDRILAESGKKEMFIVLHTLGSHFRYDLRYPAQFERFSPALGGRTGPNAISRYRRDELMNSYDNSILYADYLISSVIEKVSALGTIGTVVYISDHGEDILDDERGLFLHGNKTLTRHVSHVPFFVWTSSQYQSIYPHKTAMLHANRTSKIGGENIFDSLLDMADITYDGEDLTKSIFSSRLSFHKRGIVAPDQRIIDCDSIQ